MHTGALSRLSDLNLETARTDRIRLAFQDLCNPASREAAEALVRKCYFWATDSRLAPTAEAARTIKPEPSRTSGLWTIPSCRDSRGRRRSAPGQAVLSTPPAQGALAVSVDSLAAAKTVRSSPLNPLAEGGLFKRLNVRPRNRSNFSTRPVDQSAYIGCAAR